MFLPVDLVELIASYLSPEQLINLSLLDSAHQDVMARVDFWERYINALYPEIKFSYAKLLQEREQLLGQSEERMTAPWGLICETLRFLIELTRKGREQFHPYRPDDKIAIFSRYYFPLTRPSIVTKEVWSGRGFSQSVRYILYCTLTLELQVKQEGIVLSRYHGKRDGILNLAEQMTLSHETAVQALNDFFLSPLREGYGLAPECVHSVNVPSRLTQNNPFFLIQEEQCECYIDDCY